MKRPPPLIALLILALFAARPAQAELGRLFFTPEKRAALDHARRQKLTETQLEKPAKITVNGILQGPEGATIWLNGKPVKNTGVAAGVKVRAGDDLDSAELAPIGKPDARAASVKVGETLRAPPRP